MSTCLETEAAALGKTDDALRRLSSAKRPTSLLVIAKFLELNEFDA